jgi:hypothetical protein
MKPASTATSRSANATMVDSNPDQQLLMQSRQELSIIHWHAFVTSLKVVL